MARVVIQTSTLLRVVQAVARVMTALLITAQREPQVKVIQAEMESGQHHIHLAAVVVLAARGTMDRDQLQARVVLEVRLIHLG